MNIQQDTNTATYTISRYQPGEIWVNEQRIVRSILIRPHRVDMSWAPQSFQALTATHLLDGLDEPPEIFLLGTGANLQFPDQKWLLPFYHQGIGVEVMDSQRAVYTYTVLSSEHRHVLAGIIIK